MGGVDFFPILQAAVADLLITYSPEFQRWGVDIFLAVMTIRVAMFAWALMGGGISDPRWPGALLVMKILLGYEFITFYSTPDPLFGISFSHLITDQMTRFAVILSGSVVTTVFVTLSDILSRFIPLGLTEYAGLPVYFLAYTAIVAAQLVTVVIVGFAFIAQAVLVLVGPLFVCLFLVPHLDRLFWSWLWALLQYSFLPVCGFAYMFIGATFLTRVLTTLPPAITLDLYPTYGALVILMAAIYTVGFLMIPSLNAAIFHGGGSHNVAGMAMGAAAAGARFFAASAASPAAAASPLATARQVPSAL